MPKEVVNNRINYDNIYGRTIQHDIWLDQSVLQDSSPTFANITLSGDGTINGNLYVYGNTSIFNTNIVEFEDNILLINNLESGSGVSLLQAGIEVERGSLENFRIIYNETNKRVEVGLISDLKPISLRENNPLSNGIMIWNTASNLIESRDHIDIPITFTSTVNSTSSSTGAFIINGGLGLKKDMFIDGKIYLTGSNIPNYSIIYTDPSNNSLTLNSVQDILLSCNQKVLIPFDKQLAFGNNNQRISANSITNALNINSDGDINITPINTKKINIPNQIPLTFSTQNEKIYTDGSNNMVIAGSQDIQLLPNNGNAGGKKVFIPVDTPLVFYNINQSIISNINNDLTINAGNNILLNPGPSLDVKIPTDNGIKFGGSGNQKITSNSNNELFISSTGDLFLSGNHINIPSNVKLTFNNYNQNIYGDTNGNLYISAFNELNSTTPIFISNTTNSSCATNGSLHTNGGIGVAKNINCENSIIINSQNTDALNVKNLLGNVFTVNAVDNGQINIIAGDGTQSNPSLNIINNSALGSKNLIQLQGVFDNTPGYTIGRGTAILNNGRVFTLNLPSYSEYSNTGSKPRLSITNDSIELFSVESDTGNITTLGTFGLSNTNDSFSSTTGSVVIQGGLGVVKSIYTSGKYISNVNNTNAFNINNGFNIDTINNSTTINQNVNINIQDLFAFKITDTITTLLNIDTINKNITNNLILLSNNNLDSSDTSSGSVVLDGGIGIKKSINVGGQGNFNNKIDMKNTTIINLAQPNNPQDAATKAYVDLIKQGLHVKDSVNVATTQSGDLSIDFISGNVIDNYTLVTGDRILLKNQSNGIENGIYTINPSGLPSRSIDMNIGSRASGNFVFIKNGSMNANLGFICNSNSNNDIIGSDIISFTEFTGLGQVQTNLGLSKNFNEINVNVDNNSIEIDTLNQLRIKNTISGVGITGGSGSPLQTISDQSHVTKLGTINTGIWQASIIQVPYGGTGKSTFNSGNIVFGNGSNPLSTNQNLYYDAINTRLGLGTNSPLKDFNIKSTNTITVLLEADSDANNSNAKPEIQLNYSGSKNSFIGMTRNFNEYANNIYPNALVFSNDQTDSTSIIQLATYQQARLTILSNGNIGINTTVPNSVLSVNGTFTTTGINTFLNTTSSNSLTEGSVVITGGLSIICPDNSSNVNQGGALTVGGGVSINGDVYMSGAIFAAGTASNTFNYITLTSTDESLNLSTGSLITFGGITIQCSQNATSVTSGGGITIGGGGSVSKDFYIGGDLNVKSSSYLGNIYFTSTSVGNYIESPNVSRTTNSFLPIYFTNFNNTESNILTIDSSGIVLNDNKFIQIGGTLQTIDGYSINYTTSNLNISPNGNNYSINLGTINNKSNVNLYGNADGKLSWQSTNSNLLLTNSTIQLNKFNSTGGNIVLTTPNINSTSFLQAFNGNMSLNIGGQGDSQVTTILSNKNGDSTITFLPNNTSSTLTITENISSVFNGPSIFSDKIEYSGNSLHQTINNTGGNSMWIYFGKISNGGGISEKGYCEIDFNNGISTSTQDTTGLKLIIAINNTVCNASHSHYGNITFNSTQKPICYIFNDTTDYHLYTLLPPNSQTNVNVLTQRNNKFLLQNEGISISPNGNFSGYTGSWTQTYITNIPSTLKYTTGDLTVEGSNLKITDNLPIISNNSGSSKDLGILYQRYQNANDSGSGDIVSNNETQIFIDSLPNQSLIVSLSQIKFSNLTSSVDDYYNGYWIKITSGSNTNQVRQIISYNGSQHIATLATPFTSQNPSTGDTVYFYNNTFVVNYYDEINDTFVLGYTNNKTNTVISTDANLRLNSLLSTSVIPSTNSSSGSINLLGGISIQNTSNATSPTLGGTITTNGGVGISKDLRVGNNIGVGNSGFVPQESIHIRKSASTMRFENDISSYSYIDFRENSSNNGFGILVDGQFSLTNSVTNVSPINSNKALTINNLGYIGINTTNNILSPLVINNTNFISTNSTTGYLGIIGGATNTNDNSIASRILLNSNNNSGSVNIYTGNVTSGNVSIYTNNDIQRFIIDSQGTVTITSTTISDSNSTGSLITNGGVAIMTTQNASSITSGGALSVNGGASIKKDLYIGGDIYITGNLSAAGSITSPTINFISFTNCSLVEYFNNNLSVNGSFGILTFGFSVTPTNASENCQVEIELPGRTNSFIRKFEAITVVSGYTSEINVIPLFNTLGFAVTGTSNISIKFQSVSTSVHTFQVQCSYNLS